MNGSQHIPQEDLSLYAMGALTSEEAEAVIAHVSECAGCREELAAIHGDLAMLALSVDQQKPPAGALDRLMRQIQTGAADAAALGTSAAAPEVARRPVAAEAGRRRRWPLILPWALTAVLASTCIFLAVEDKNLNDTLSDESALISNLAAKASRAQEIVDVLNARDAQRVVLTARKAPSAPSAQVIYLPDRGALLFSATNLKPVPAGKTYELWVIPANGEAPLPAGTFRPNDRGDAHLTLPTLKAGVVAKQFGVTIENQGGSASPTLPIVLAGE